LLRQGIESQERQRDNDKSTISALNAQLVASNQRFYALDTDYKVVVEELGRTSIQINELFNTKRATEEREALLTAQREVMQNEIDQFQGILDKLQAMHGATESDLGREKSHVDALMKLVEVATNAFSKLGKSHE
jgi:chromosome segregation ATPase